MPDIRQKSSDFVKAWVISALYDRINLTVPKGKKDTIQAHAEAQGESVNGFINAAIDARTTQEDAGGTGAVSLYPDTLKAAQEAAEAAGEGLPQFIERAVTTQAKRDEAARKMEGAE